MKVLLTKEIVRIPEKISLTLKHKTVIVAGPYGQEQRDFPCPQLDMQLQVDTIEVSCWLATKKTRAMVETVCGHIRNLINE